MWLPVLWLIPILAVPDKISYPLSAWGSSLTITLPRISSCASTPSSACPTRSTSPSTAACPGQWSQYSQWSVFSGQWSQWSVVSGLWSVASTYFYPGNSEIPSKLSSSTPSTLCCPCRTPHLVGVLQRGSSWGEHCITDIVSFCLGCSVSMNQHQCECHHQCECQWPPGLTYLEPHDSPNSLQTPGALQVPQERWWIRSVVRCQVSGVRCQV